jgi:hypothetical protein
MTERQTPELVLDEREEELVRVLCEVSNEISPPPVLRIAGGWVRDKVFNSHTPTILKVHIVS